MIHFIIPLLACYMPMFPYVLWHILGLSFICFVPFFIRSFLRR